MVEARSDRPTALVTGSSRGIGLAIAQRLAGDGYRLLLVARDDSRLREVADRLGEDTVATAAIDLTSPTAIDRIADAAERTIGTPDVVVNNAGTAPSDKLENTSDAMVQETFDLHVRVPLALGRTFARAMKARGSGCILNLASTAGLRGYPFTSAYTAAKHGMVGLSRALHAELAPKAIQVYAVCPGFVDTDITRRAAAAVASMGKTTAEAAFDRMAAQNRIGRMHTTDEVADAVARLLRERPQGCVYDLDRDPAGFVD